MKAQEGVFDRIGQSVSLFTWNFKQFLNIFGLYFLYKVFYILILWNILYFLFMKFFDFNKIFSSWNVNNFLPLLFWDTSFIIWFNVYLVFVLLNLILVIPFILATIKTIKDYFNEKEKVDVIDNLKYWFKNLWNSFKTYWYMFAYVVLIPLSILIIWWLFIIFWKYGNISIFYQIWLIISAIGIFLLIIFSIYRWLKTSFSIVCAVDENEYTLRSFKKSIDITKNNWWRILGNFLLVSILLSIIFWIINSIISIFKFSVSDFDYWTFLNLLNNNWEFSVNQFETMVNLYAWKLWNFWIKTFLFNFLDLFLNTLKVIFVLVFTYIFYKRLEFEKFWKSDNVEKMEVIEKNVEL